MAITERVHGTQGAWPPSGGLPERRASPSPHRQPAGRSGWRDPTARPLSRAVSGPQLPFVAAASAAAAAAAARLPSNAVRSASPHRLCRRSLARVCRRWRQLVDSPALLRGVSVRLAAVDKFNYSYEWDEDRSDSEDPGWHDMDLYADALYADPEMPVRHIFDFCGWLQRRAAPHVQQLTVRLGELNLLGEPELSCDQSVTSALRRAIKACTRLQVGGCKGGGGGGGGGCMLQQLLLWNGNAQGATEAGMCLPVLPSNSRHRIDVPRPGTTLQTLPAPAPCSLPCPLQHLLLSMQCSLRLCPSDDLAPAAQAQLRSLFVTCLSTVADPERQACLQVGGLLALTALESLHLAGNKLLLGNLPSTGRTRMGPPLPPQQQQQQQPQPADGLPPSLTSLALDGFVDVTSSVRQFVPAQVGMGWHWPAAHALQCNCLVMPLRRLNCSGHMPPAGPFPWLRSAAEGR